MKRPNYPSQFLLLFPWSCSCFETLSKRGTCRDVFELLGSRTCGAEHLAGLHHLSGRSGHPASRAVTPIILPKRCCFCLSQSSRQQSSNAVRKRSMNEGKHERRYEEVPAVYIRAGHRRAGCRSTHRKGWDARPVRGLQGTAMPCHAVTGIVLPTVQTVVEAVSQLR